MIVFYEAWMKQMPIFVKHYNQPIAGPNGVDNITWEVFLWYAEAAINMENEWQEVSASRLKQ